MRRNDLIRHLNRNGWELLREGGNHSIFVNRPLHKSMGMCKSCPEPERPGESRCTTCRKKHVESCRAYRQRRRAQAKNPGANILNYSRQNWVQEDGKDEVLTQYALEGHSNSMIAGDRRITLYDETFLEEGLDWNRQAMQ